MAKQKTQSSLTVSQVINKWKLNKALLAFKMGMPKGTFNNKLNPTHASQFSNAEYLKLSFILADLSKDIDNLEPIDFNKVLSILTKSKK
jgi:hypothetical protein